MNVNTLQQRQCAVEGCKRQYYAAGFCSAHFRRTKRWGDVRAGLPIMGANEPIKDKLLRLRRIDPVTECWEWLGAIGKGGYGNINWKGKTYRVHRIALHLWSGFDLSSPFMALHHCDNRRCFNTSHLFLGTARDNIHDCLRKGRYRVGKKRLGEKHHKAKLTDTKVREIRERNAKGESLRSMYRDYGVSYSTVIHAARGHFWRHVA